MAKKSKERGQPTFIEEARRKQIIESTILTLSKRGFINTSLADIAEEIGVTKGVISYHFDGKDDLINATLETIIHTQVDMRREQITLQSSAKGKLRAYFQANQEFLETYPNYMTALLELWASFSTPEARLLFNTSAYEPAREQLMEIFTLGQSTGEFHRFDKLLMAGLIQGGIDGISFQWVFNPDRVDVAQSFQELLEIFEKRIHQQ